MTRKELMVADAECIARRCGWGSAFEMAASIRRYSRKARPMTPAEIEAVMNAKKRGRTEQDRVNANIAALLQDG